MVAVSAGIDQASSRPTETTVRITAPSFVISTAMATPSSMVSSGVAAATLSLREVRAGTRPPSARIVWYSSLMMISSAFWASSGLADLAEIPMFEPPANTEATPPSLPGRLK